MNAEEAKKTVKEVFSQEKKKPKGLVAKFTDAESLNVVQQADILFLPKYPGTLKKYVLVLADLATRRVAARPLSSKSANSVMKALKDIYENDPKLRPPSRLETDKGSEFRGVARDWLESKGVYIRYGIQGRHRQQGLAKSINRILGRAISILQSERELQKGKTDRSWVSDLPDIVKEINKRLERDPVPSPTSLPRPANKEDTVILDIGTRVRRVLDRPQDILGNKLPEAGTKSGRRAGDQTYETRTRKIESVKLIPGQSPRYILEGLPEVSYARYELQLPAPRGKARKT